jgi:serine/threonine-protein kinase
MAEVLKEGHHLGLLKAGDCFGEMGYLEKSVRSATIRARESMQMMKINATLIDQVSVDCQLRFSKVFLKTLVRRLSNTNVMVVSQQD